MYSRLYCLLTNAVILLWIPQYCYARDLPPVIDIYPISSAKEVDALKNKIEHLQKELDTVRTTLEAQSKSLERYQSSTSKKTWGLFSNPAASLLKPSPLSSKRENAANQAFQEIMRLFHAKHYIKAIHATKRFMIQYPSHAEYATSYHLLAQLFLLKGDPDQALYYAKHFINKYPKDPRLPEAQFYMGLAYYAKQNNKAALQTFTQLKNTYPHHAITQQVEEHLTHMNLNSSSNTP